MRDGAVDEETVETCCRDFSAAGDDVLAKPHDDDDVQVSSGNTLTIERLASSCDSSPQASRAFTAAAIELDH